MLSAHLFSSIIKIFIRLLLGSWQISSCAFSEPSFSASLKAHLKCSLIQEASPRISILIQFHRTRNPEGFAAHCCLLRSGPVLVTGTSAKPVNTRLGRKSNLAAKFPILHSPCRHLQPISLLKPIPSHRTSLPSITEYFPMKPRLSLACCFWPSEHGNKISLLFLFGYTAGQHGEHLQLGDEGSNPCPSGVEEWSLNHWTAREVPD